MIIIGVTGKIGSGKEVVSEYLKSKYDFTHYSARNYITAEVLKKNLPVNRQTMISVANEIRASKHPGFIIEELYNMAVVNKKDSVIESIRTLGEIETLKSKGSFYLLGIEVDQKIRYERIVLRNSETDRISFEQFKKDDDLESTSGDPNKQNITACIKKADYVLNNSGTFEELYKQVDESIEKIKTFDLKTK
jgi:dephospho-CoA kinase